MRCSGKKCILCIFCTVIGSLVIVSLVPPVKEKIINFGVYSSCSNEEDAAASTANSIVCDSIKCRDSIARTGPVIPEIRHILWRNRSIPSYFAAQLKTWYSIQPDWRYILWTDSDIEAFVAKHYPHILQKFNSLQKYMMRVDMVRYMLLHKYGGVYADVDYVLVKSIEEFLTLPAVVTRESEAHSFITYGMGHWPPRVLANPALFMSSPGHKFLSFCIESLRNRPAVSIATFAGPRGMSDLLCEYKLRAKLDTTALEAVYIPPSYSFYPYKNNSLSTSTSQYQAYIHDNLLKRCSDPTRARAPQLDAYCSNRLNLDPVTDSTVPVYAVHDNMKKVSTYDKDYTEKNLVPISESVPTIEYGHDLLMKH